MLQAPSIVFGVVTTEAIVVELGARAGFRFP